MYTYTYVVSGGGEGSSHLHPRRSGVRAALWVKHWLDPLWVRECREQGRGCMLPGVSFQAVSGGFVAHPNVSMYM